MKLRENIRRILREEFKLPPSVKRRLNYVDEYINILIPSEVCKYWTVDEVDNYVNGVMSEIVRNIIDDSSGITSDEYSSVYDGLYEILVNLDYSEQIRDFFYDSMGNCDKSLNESEDKKPSLLSTIEQHGLYEFMKMTGLSLKQIKSKIDEIPREVFETYIKDFLENDEIGLDLSIPISPNKRADSFYLSDGVVTIELNELDSIGRVVAGSFERLSALSDDEIFSLVDEMTQIDFDDFLDYM